MVFSRAWAACFILNIGVLGGYGCKRQIATPVLVVAGKDWTQSTTSTVFTPRYYQTGVVYNSKMWIIGGNAGNWNYLNDVWSSTNGTAWSQATTNAGFSQRYALSSLVYGGKMWVIGGYDSNGLFQNDVWSSSDGVTWTPVTSAASFSGRAAMGCVVFNNAMYVIGGFSPSLAGSKTMFGLQPTGPIGRL